AIRLLSMCTHIIELSIRVRSPEYDMYNSQPFDLSVLASFFPFLESLTLCGLGEYIGQLEAANLQRLSFYFFVNDPVIVHSALIPFESTRTLTSLCIVDHSNSQFDN